MHGHSIKNNGTNCACVSSPLGFKKNPRESDLPTDNQSKMERGRVFPTLSDSKRIRKRLTRFANGHSTGVNMRTRREIMFFKSAIRRPLPLRTSPRRCSWRWPRRQDYCVLIVRNQLLMRFSKSEFQAAFNIYFEEKNSSPINSDIFFEK